MQMEKQVFCVSQQQFPLVCVHLAQEILRRMVLKWREEQYGSVMQHYSAALYIWVMTE